MIFTFFIVISQPNTQTGSVKKYVYLIWDSICNFEGTTSSSKRRLINNAIMVTRKNT